MQQRDQGKCKNTKKTENSNNNNKIFRDSAVTARQIQEFTGNWFRHFIFLLFLLCDVLFFVVDVVGFLLQVFA